MQKNILHYFDLTFEETLRRHLTRSKCREFGEEAMRRWWREKDFSDVLKEVRITAEKEMEDIVTDICNAVKSDFQKCLERHSELTGSPK